MAKDREDLNEDVGRPASEEVIGTGDDLDDDEFDEDEVDEEEDEEP